MDRRNFLSLLVLIPVGDVVLTDDGGGGGGGVVVVPWVCIFQVMVLFHGFVFFSSWKRTAVPGPTGGPAITSMNICGPQTTRVLRST